MESCDTRRPRGQSPKYEKRRGGGGRGPGPVRVTRVTSRFSFEPQTFFQALSYTPLFSIDWRILAVPEQ